MQGKEPQKMVANKTDLSNTDLKDLDTVDTSDFSKKIVITMKKSKMSAHLRRSPFKNLKASYLEHFIHRPL